MTRKTTVSTHVPKEVVDVLKRQAKEQDRSISWVVGKILESSVKQKLKKKAS